MVQTVFRYKGRIIELSVQESEVLKLLAGRTPYELTARLWRPEHHERRLLLVPPTGDVRYCFNEAAALDSFALWVRRWIDCTPSSIEVMPPALPPSYPARREPKASSRTLLAAPRRSVGTVVSAVNNDIKPPSVVEQRSNMNMPKARKQRLNLASLPGRCIVCHRPASAVELHPYTSSRVRLFCRRDHDVGEAIRRKGYAHSSRTSPYLPTTVLMWKHRRLIERMEDRLSAEDIATVLIYVEYGDLV